MNLFVKLALDINLRILFGPGTCMGFVPITENLSKSCAFVFFYPFSYKWRHVIFFYERNGQYRVAGLHTCHLAMQTMANTYRKNNITYSSFTTDSAANNITENLRREVGLDQSSKFELN